MFGPELAIMRLYITYLPVYFVLYFIRSVMVDVGILRPITYTCRIFCSYLVKRKDMEEKCYIKCVF